jgi:hypothetical protein
MNTVSPIQILERSRRKFISISTEGEFFFSRGLCREEGLDQSTHCYLAYSVSHQVIFFCFTKGMFPAGAFRLLHQKPKGSLLKAPAFFEHFRLNPCDWAGPHPVKKTVWEGVDWHMISLPEEKRPSKTGIFINP